MGDEMNLNHHFRNETLQLIKSMDESISDTLLASIIRSVGGRKEAIFLITKSSKEEQLENLNQTIKAKFRNTCGRLGRMSSQVVPVSQTMQSTELNIAQRKPSFVYTFDPCDCFLKEEVIAFVFHKWSFGFVVLMLIVYTSLVFFHGLVRCIIGNIMRLLIFYPWVAFYLAALNKGCMRLLFLLV